jgi:flavin-dependent dehydrogenase
MSMLEIRTSARPREAEPVTVVGAGPAGLACAIALARTGRRVVVREWHGDVGARFHGDFQGLENWSDERDALDELAAAGIKATFEYHAVSRGTVYDSRGKRYQVWSGRPLFYLLRRGGGAGSLDHDLLGQANEAGVEVMFGVSGEHRCKSAIFRAVEILITREPAHE